MPATTATRSFAATGAFLRDWKRADGRFQHAIRHAVADLCARIASGSEWERSYDTIKGIDRKKYGRYKEIDVSSSRRLILRSDTPELRFFAVGRHETTSTFRQRLGEREATGLFPPPPALLRQPSKFFLPRDETGTRQIVRWTPEMGTDAEWLYFLDEQQVVVRDAIADDLLARSAGAGWSGAAHLILGGPGTGKTSLLLSALHDAVALSEEPPRRGTTIRLVISDAMSEFLTACTGVDYEHYRVSSRKPLEKADILLVDDPPTLGAAAEHLLRSRKKNHKGVRPLVVVAADPLQLDESSTEVTDAALTTILTKARAREPHWLSSCYRQKEAPGRIAYDAATIVAESSPFSKDERKASHARARADLRSRANAVTFTNPSGIARQYPNAGLDDWRRYIAMVTAQLQADAAMGALGDWPGLLVVTPDVTLMSEDWRALLTDLPCHVHPDPDYWHDSWVRRIKGLEYRHVAVIVSQEDLDDITDVDDGHGPKRYEHLRRLRIPLSRARDSLAVFGVAPSV